MHARDQHCAFVTDIAERTSAGEIQWRRKRFVSEGVCYVASYGRLRLQLASPRYGWAELAVRRSGTLRVERMRPRVEDLLDAVVAQVRPRELARTERMSDWRFERRLRRQGYHPLAK